jgi:CHASE2 domain-containing sensor protein
MVEQAQEQLKVAGDIVSVSTVIATIAGWLPAVAALLTIVWTGIRIWETDTVKKWRKRWTSK